MKDLIYGGVGRQSAVKHTELAFETLGDVIAPAAGMDHGSHQLQVDNTGEFPRSLQAVETSLLHQLTHDLISYLINKNTAMSVKYIRNAYFFILF